MRTQAVGPFLLPDYPNLSIQDWRVHLQRAHDQAQAAILALPGADAPADFQHTFLAMEEILGRLQGETGLFFAAQAPHATPEMTALAEEWVGPLSLLNVSLYQNQALFERCQAASRAWVDAPVAERRLMDKHLRAFREAGLGLPADRRDRLAQITSRLAELGQAFQRQCQEAGSVVVVLPEAAGAGLSEEDVQAARSRARDKGEEGLGFVLQPMQVESWLGSMEHRPSRQALWQACTERGSGRRDRDAAPMVREILALRAERAGLLGYPGSSHHLVVETMAGTPDKAMGLVQDTWERLAPALRATLAVLEQMARSDGLERLEPWDVDYYARRHRQEQFDFDARALRPYLPLPAVRQGAFRVAERLFGLVFEPVPARLYHPDAKAYLVRSGRDGPVAGLLVVDDLIRETKAPGAWMDNLRPSSRLGDEPVLPWVVNVCNFLPPQGPAPALLDMDDAITLFHELGHALHSLLSQARYPSQAGTSVAQDFVELPSQILENWIHEPEGLREVARHWQTGEPLPEDMLARLLASRTFGQGLDMARYLASAYLDLAVHSDPQAGARDPAAFQAESLAALGVPAAIAPRHGLLHFSHLFSGDAYAAGYYSYLWAEVLEADAFGRFREEGLFSPDLGRALGQAIFAPGGSEDPAVLFRRFRGRDPSPEALLAKRGLLPAPSRSRPGPG